MTDVELLTFEEVRTLLRLGKATLFRLKKQDELFPNAVKIGHRTLWNKEDIINYIKLKKVGSDTTSSC